MGFLVGCDGVAHVIVLEYYLILVEVYGASCVRTKVVTRVDSSSFLQGRGFLFFTEIKNLDPNRIEKI